MEKQRDYYSLNYSFRTRDIMEMRPGDSLPSSCSPLETTIGQRLLSCLGFSNPPLHSPSGFPLHFSLRLVCHRSSIVGSKAYPAPPNYPQTHVLLLQLRLAGSRDVPFLPPLLIQPVAVLRSSDHGDFEIPGWNPRLDRRLVGPLQPAFWQIMKNHVRRSSRRQAFPISVPQSIHAFLFNKLKGEFRFRLLEEPMSLIANLPPISEKGWSCLPKDMVCAVLRELPLADRVKARLVCQSWSKVLDNDSRAWDNVTFLESIAEFMENEEGYGYHGGKLNQVRNHQLLQALAFLAARKAPIQALELNTAPSLSQPDFPDPYLLNFTALSNLLSKHGITLKSLALGSGCLLPMQLKAGMMELIESQPSLECLYLDWFSFWVIPSLGTLRSALPSLRILGLSVSYHLHQQPLDGVQFMRPLLEGLEGFRLYLDYKFPFAHSEPIFGAIDKLGLDLHRVSGAAVAPDRRLQAWQLEGVGRDQAAGCRCLGIWGWEQRGAVWGSEGLSSAAAAYLLMPHHYRRSFGRAFQRVSHCHI